MDIFVSGLGGLGLISMAKKLCVLLGKQHEKVISVETRGIAQRRGSVSAFVRAGKNVQTPHLYNNRADVILALEALEGLRNTSLVESGTVCLISDLCVNNLGGSQNSIRYPSIDEITYTLSKLGGRVLIIPFEKFMLENRLLKVHISTVALGISARLFGYSLEEIKRTFPPKILDQKNLLSLEWGYELFSFEAQEVLEEKNIA